MLLVKGRGRGRATVRVGVRGRVRVRVRENWRTILEVQLALAHTWVSERVSE